MKLEHFDISEKKLTQLLKRIEDLEISLEDVEEKFVTGSGKGGQKVNKTANCVHLHHIPTGIRVSCQRERERNKNRFIALRLLVDHIEAKLRPGKDPQSQKAAKLRKQKARRRRRSREAE